MFDDDLEAHGWENPIDAEINNWESHMRLLKMTSSTESILWLRKQLEVFAARSYGHKPFRPFRMSSVTLI
jgi:hypothetical protein